MASSLDFDWHDGKAASNLKKHGLSFADARQVFSIRASTGTRRGGGRRRAAQGRPDGSAPSYTVVYTERGRLVWLISARRANRTEEKRYGQFPA